MISYGFEFSWWENRTTMQTVRGSGFATADDAAHALREARRAKSDVAS